MLYTKKDLIKKVDSDELSVSLEAILVTAQYYNINSLVKWAKKELEGYGLFNVPKYRITKSKIQMKDKNKHRKERYASTKILAGVSTLESRIKNNSEIHGSVSINFIINRIYIFFERVINRIISPSGGFGDFFIALLFLTTFFIIFLTFISFIDIKLIKIPIYVSILYIPIIYIIGMLPPYTDIKFNVNYEDVYVAFKMIKTESKRMIEMYFSNDLEAFEPPEFDEIIEDIEISNILKNRWREANRSFQAESYLSTIIILGSILEGTLLYFIEKYPAEANICKAAPKDKNLNVKKFSEWTFYDLIVVSHECGLIDKEIKDFSSSLREYRNLVHPKEQKNKKINPDIHTCKVSWEVINSAFFDLRKYLKSKNKN